jgi:hypothetical protein
VWVLYVASAILVLLGGAFAGLTIACVHTSIPCCPSPPPVNTPS